VGLPTVLWSRALRIQEQSVRVQQCVDYSSVQTTQHGKPIEGESQRPLLREIDLSVPAGETKYLIQQIHDPSWGRRVTTCKA